MNHHYRVIWALFGFMVLAASAQASDVQAPVSESKTYRYSVGLGYPDLRLRAAIWGPLDLEFKYALGDGMQAYSGRLYCRAYHLGAFDVIVGAEGGALSFNGVGGLSGGGSFYQAYAGGEYSFGKRVALNLDFGPAYINVGNSAASLGGMEWVVNTALYFRVF